MDMCKYFGLATTVCTHQYENASTLIPDRCEPCTVYCESNDSNPMAVGNLYDVKNSGVFGNLIVFKRFQLSPKLVGKLSFCLFIGAYVICVC